MTVPTSTPRASWRRRVHVTVALAYAAFLYVFSPMNLLFIGWFADFEDAISHRVHEVSIGALFAVGFLGVLAHLKRTDRAAGSIQAVVALCLAAGVITTTTGFEPLVLAYLIPPLVLVLLDPEWRSTVAPPMVREPRLVLLAAVLVALVGPQVLRNFVKAEGLVQGHEGHWGAMAAFSITVSLLAIVVAMRPPGWRPVGWSVVAAVTTNAVVSMAFRFDASALGINSATLVLVWAAGFTVCATVASSDPSRVPMRLPTVGLVAGVAAGLAARTRRSAQFYRVLFAVPFIGSAAYLILWLALPTDRGETVRSRWLGVVTSAAVAAGTVVVVLGSSFFLAPIFLVVAPFFFLTQRRERWAGHARPRLRFASRIVASLATMMSVFLVVLVWMVDDFSPPNVPHRIDRIATEYCSTCHGIEGVARGAPILDILEHSDGAACVSCHSHLPPVRSSVSDAVWRLPLGRIGP